jgi:hypothetical protein
MMNNSFKGFIHLHDDSLIAPLHDFPRATHQWNLAHSRHLFLNQEWKHESIDQTVPIWGRNAWFDERVRRG